MVDMSRVLKTRVEGRRRARIAIVGVMLALVTLPALAGKPGITLSVPGVAMKGDVIKVKVGVSGSSEGVWYHVKGLRFLRGYFDHCGWCGKPCLVNDQIQACPTPPDGCCFNLYCLTCNWYENHEFGDTWYGGPTWEFEVTGCDTATIQAEYYGNQHEGPFMGPIHEIHILDGIHASFHASEYETCTGERIFFSNTSCGGTSFNWSFGDGDAAVGEHVSHVYDTPGVYTVTLTASSPADSDSSSNTITVAADCATIEGTITDVVDGSPLPGAGVDISSGQEQYSAHTDTPGTYSLKVPPDVTYKVTAWRPGYLNGGPVSVTPGPNETVTQDLALQPEDQEPVDPLADLGPEWTNVDDPVNPATGNFTFTRMLFGFPGLAGFDFAFQLTYNSLAGGSDGPLGHGWTHSYNVFLTWSGQDYTLHLPDGSRRFFHHDTAAGTYDPVNCHAFGKLEDRSPNGWTYTMPRGLIYQLDALGRLERFVDLHGNAITLTYSTQLDRITDTAGREVELHYTGTRLTSITSPLTGGDTASFTYDANGDLRTITDPRGNTWSFTYDSLHRMLTETNRRGIVAMTNAYDPQGRVVRQTDAAGHDTTYTYSNLAGGRIQVVITPPSGHAVIHVYDGSGHLLRSTDGEGHTATFAYDANGLPASLTDKMGRVATLEFNESGRLTAATDRLGGSLQLSYDGNGFLTEMQDELGNTLGSPRDPAGNLYNFSLPDANFVRFMANPQGLNVYMEDFGNNPWDFQRDAQGLVSRVTSRLNYRADYHHDAAGRLTQLDLPDGIGSWHYAYDAGGHLTSVTSPRGTQITYTHDGEGNTTSRTFIPTGATTTWTYDNLGRVHTMTDALGGVKTYTYDVDSNLKSITDPDGVTIQYGYDRRNALVSVTRASGATTAFAHDANGNVVTLTDPLGNSWSFTYDAEGRQVRSVDPLGHATERILSEDDRRATIVDALGRETLLIGNTMGEVETILLPNGNRIQRHWSSLGKIFAVTDGRGDSWRYFYDTLHRLVAVDDPEGAREEYGYDLGGRRTQLRRPDGQLITYEYDGDNRTTAIHFPGGTNIDLAYAYDPTGTTTTITEPVGVTVLHQDLLGRFDRKTDPFGNTVALSYTPGGRLARVTYPGNHVVTYSYDAAGRLDHITDWLGHVTRYHHDGADRVSKIDFPNGTSVSYTYDATGQLVGLTHTAGSTTLMDYTISRDALGRVASMAVTGAPAAAPGDSSRQDAFDRANRIETIITDMDATNFTFDPSGRLVEKRRGNMVTTYTYDALDRLAQVADGTHTTTYTMDWEGSAIRVVHDGTETRYLRRGNRLWAALDSGNTPLRYYVTAPGGILYALEASGSLRVFHTDPQGNVVAITDGSGTVTAAFTYDPYGKVLASTGQSELRYLGAWGVLADANGLHQMGRRMYDPELRRFLTKDPLGLRASLNLYAYTEGDPVNRIDPQGTVEWTLPSDLSFMSAEELAAFQAEAAAAAEQAGATLVNADAPVLSYPQNLDFMSPEEFMEFDAEITQAAREMGAKLVGKPKLPWMESAVVEGEEMLTGPVSQQLSGSILQRIYQGASNRGRQLLGSVKETLTKLESLASTDMDTIAVEGLTTSAAALTAAVAFRAYMTQHLALEIPNPLNGTDEQGHWMTGDEVIYRSMVPAQVYAWTHRSEDPVLYLQTVLHDLGMSYDDYLKIAASVGQ